MWNRLEPSIHNESQLENALRFEVRDPLWMLARQWQFGELTGEDAGTAAFSRVFRQQTPVQLIGSAATQPLAFDYAKTPFEVPVEHVLVVPDLHLRLEMGRHWLRLLKKRLPAAKAQQYSTAFKKNTKFMFAAPDSSDRVDNFRQAHLMSDEALRLTLETIAGGRMLDGFALYKALKSGLKASSFSQPDATVDAVGQEFVQWFERTYSQFADTPNTWHPQHMEYQPQLAFQDSQSAVHILKKDEYYGDGISWHGFESQATWNDQPMVPLPPAVVQSSSETIIPANVRFRGMPSTRLWEMEDAQVDFGSIRAASTDLSKMIFAEFSLIFGNDWLVAPLRVTGGSLCRVAGLAITDVFGRQQALDEIKPDANWALFQMPTLNQQEDGWLFFAHGDELAQESGPIEKVSFRRDEMANLVWGIEEIVSDPGGGGRDGERLASQVRQWLENLDQPVQSPSGQSSAEGWVYKAGTSMPENRIPFIPVASGSSQNLGHRQVVLQRAALPRISDEFEPVRVRPRTSILGNIGQPENEKLAPFFLFEEEVPRSGAEVQLVWKRTRWLGGSTHTWLAYKKTIGKGELDSNFKYDVLRRSATSG
ncbi:hypothetical protein HMF3257_32775 [Spirosoma telluris]|uniref:Uncharacterized protein n=2 Tax=Spirosoma telluris TaxID=2183553 RepID=A0A327NT19_9BACT|nr:hypothetical protein HMF3257_32775 [Spirosoma telluris]